MEKKHTQGPLEVNPSLGGYTIVSSELKPLAIATTYFGPQWIGKHHTIPPEEAKANADLFAAAPATLQQRDELLEAIERIESQAREAVAVVSGQWHGVVGDKLCAIVTYIRNQARSAIAAAKVKE